MYLLKTSENQSFSNVLREYRIEALACSGLEKEYVKIQ